MLKLTDLNASEIYKNRFDSGIPRSVAYHNGFADKLNQKINGQRILRPYKEATPEADAWHSGFQHAGDRIQNLLANDLTL